MNDLTTPTVSGIFAGMLGRKLPQIDRLLEMPSKETARQKMPRSRF